MREVTVGDVNIKYPDEIGFAFNPCLVIAETEAGIDVMRLEVTDGEETVQEQREGFGEKCYVDFREYVQGFFDTNEFGELEYTEVEKTKLGKGVNVQVSVTDKEAVTTTFSFSVFYIWGALRAGGQEKYNEYRTMTWFVGYPFSVGVYAGGAAKVLLSRDKVANKVLEIPEQGVWNVRIDDERAREYIKVSDLTGTLEEATFDNTFDLTFRLTSIGGEVTDKVRVNVVRCSKKGVYLRWVDRQGFFQYYLFEIGNETRKVSNEGEFLRNNLLAYDMTYGFTGGNGRQQTKAREDTIQVCAPMIDEDTFESLFDLTTSPLVDMYLGTDEEDKPRWLSVNIQAGNYTKEKGVSLRDFVCNVVMPEMAIQKL